ncbi:MAG: hypothetical protein KGZ25_08565 [Planctomycetes bacterium]|nr:hypothetical protein [Planctomycetota bacterium]
MKTSQTQLINDIADDFTHYLKAGGDKFFNFSTYSREIDPNLNIDRIEKLLRIHFVLTRKGDAARAGVIDFVRELPRRVRRIKTTVSHRKDLFHGEVRGRIDWKGTIGSRYARNPRNKSIFACSQREKNYNIDENLVLKKLLQVVHSIVYGELEPAIRHGYRWVSNWVADGRKLQRTLERIFLRNVYLRRIDLADVRVTERMISKAKKSRQPLYREAAHLLARYRRLMNYEFEPDEARELLRNTFIQPDRAEVLFELYWIIKIIKHCESRSGAGEITFNIIEPGKNVIAEWENGGCTYRLYHDSTGDFEFSESVFDLLRVTDSEDNYVGREVRVLGKLEEMVKLKSDSLWGGRPDILLEKRGPEGKIEALMIGEVKYTDKADYAIQGLRELIEYIALIKDAEDYVVPFDDLFEKMRGIRGCLFLDSYDGPAIEEDSAIGVITFGEELPEEFLAL